MLNKLSEIVQKYKKGADYLEVRVEESEGTEVRFRGKEMENVSQPLSRGGCVRALCKGGWGFISFNNLDNLADRVEEAISQARLTGQGKSQLAVVKPVKDKVPVKFKNDPRLISLSEKVHLSENYHRYIWSLNPQISDAAVVYSDSFTKVYFVSSEGARIIQEFSDNFAGALIVARKGDIVQQASVTVADPYDYAVVRGLEPKIKECVEMAVRLLQAKPVKGGNYTVVLDQELSGVLMHEAFGHLSEADFIYENESFRKLMKIGRLIGVEGLNMVDDPTLKGRRGSYKYDDEGVLATKTYLIKGGVLTGRLHSRETAAKMQESASGNARAASFRSRPLVRMSNTYIEPGNADFNEMIRDIKLGVYACGSLGGTTDREMFTFTAKWGYMIRDGEVSELVRDVKLTGNIFKILKRIECIGNDLQIGKKASLCGKGGQWVRVDVGAPHLRIKDVTIGGQ